MSLCAFPQLARTHQLTPRPSALQISYPTPIPWDSIVILNFCESVPHKSQHFPMTLKSISIKNRQHMCPPYFWGHSAAVVVHKEPNLLAALDFTWRKAVTIGKTRCKQKQKSHIFLGRSSWTAHWGKPGAQIEEVEKFFKSWQELIHVPAQNLILSSGVNKKPFA